MADGKGVGGVGRPPAARVAPPLPSANPLPSACGSFAVRWPTAKGRPTANKTFALGVVFVVCFVPADGKEALCHVSTDGKGKADDKILNSSSEG